MSRRSSDLDPAFDPVAERLLDIGRHLRETRQQRGEDLYDVADYLRIKPSYLFALEEGDLAAMPGHTYAMGFLRTYGDHLGFNGADIVRGLNATTDAENGSAFKIRKPAPENSLPSLAVVVVALVLAGVGYGSWYAAQSGGEVLARIKAVPGEIGQYAASLFDDEATAGVADTPEPRPLEMRVAGNDHTSPPATATPSVTGTPATGDASATVDHPATGLPAREVTASNATETRTGADGTRTDPTEAIAATAAIEPPTGAATGNENAFASLVLDAQTERNEALRRLDEERPDGGTVGELLAGLQADAADGSPDTAATTPVTSTTGRVVLLAREASWIQVQSPSRDFLRSTTLEPGERFEIPDRTDLALWTGNAGGVEIWVDGRNIGVLGRSGAVVRDVSLAPASLIERR